MYSICLWYISNYIVVHDTPNITKNLDVVHFEVSIPRKLDFIKLMHLWYSKIRNLNTYQGLFLDNQYDDNTGSFFSFTY